MAPQNEDEAMRLIQSLLVFFMMAPASARVTELTEAVAPSKVEVRAICPTDQCMINGTRVHLSFEIPCDGEIKLDYRSEENKGDLHVYVNSRVIYPSEEGETCQGLRNVTETIELPEQYGELFFHNEGESPYPEA